MTLEKWCKENNKPLLLQEWDYEKNSIAPKDISFGSAYKANWKCSICGNCWPAAIYSRAKGGRCCPECAKTKRGKTKTKSTINKFRSIVETHPALLDEWDYEKNNITPDQITHGSHKKVWWKCSKGHEWQAIIPNRLKGYGCPYCSGRYAITGINDLQTMFPDIAEEWHPTKNENTKPSEVLPQSNIAYWWLGKCGHEWKSNPYNRTKNKQGCPYCAGQKVLAGFNDLATTNPEMLKEWDYSKNDVLPTMVSAGSARKIWWLCPLGHSYKSALYSKCKNTHSGCPICEKENKSSFPEQALFYYVKKAFPDAINSDRSAIGMELDIYIPSINTAIEYDGNVWHQNNKLEETKNSLCKENNIQLIRVREKGLPLYENCICIIRENVTTNESLCETVKKVLLLLNIYDLDIDIVRDTANIYSNYIINRKEKSLLSEYPEIAKEWHPTKNGNLTPDQFAPNSNKKAWWLCSAGHEWCSVISSRTSKKKHGCPKCKSAKQGERSRKRVLNVDTGEIFNSVREAGQKTGIDERQIGKVCRGEGKTAKGFHWKYLD